MYSLIYSLIYGFSIAVPSDCVANVRDAVRGLALADAYVRDVAVGEPVAALAGTAAALHAADCDHIDPLALRRQCRESDV